MSPTGGGSNARPGAAIAAGVYLVTAALAMRLAIRDGIGAEPLGVRMGSASKRDALFTNGTALSAHPSLRPTSSSPR